MAMRYVLILAALLALLFVTACSSDPAGIESSGIVSVPKPKPKPTIVLTATHAPEPTATTEPPVPPTVTPPLSTATPIPPTATPSPLATNTPHVDPTATSTPTVVSPSGIAYCEHNDRAWHALVERNADNSINCTYGHFHGDDPKTLDYFFGPLPASLGGEISYPHETHMENHNKHRVYKWSTVDLGSNCAAANATLGLRRARAQFHADGTLGDIVRRHSYWLQVELCDPNDPSYSGRIEIGGHQDYGRLVTVNASDGSPRWIPIPGQDALHPPITENKGSDRRVAGGDGWFKGDSTWYGSNRFARTTDPVTGAIVPPASNNKVSVEVGVIKEAWGGISDDLLIHYYKPTSRHVYRGAWIEPIHLLEFVFSGTNGARLDALDGTTDGRINLTGNVDRWGFIVPGTCVPGPDCSPVTLTNIKTGIYQFRRDAAGLSPRNYDVKDPATGQSLIENPN